MRVVEQQTLHQAGDEVRLAAALSQRLQWWLQIQQIKRVSAVHSRRQNAPHQLQPERIAVSTDVALRHFQLIERGVDNGRGHPVSCYLLEDAEQRSLELFRAGRFAAFHAADKHQLAR